jgi:tetrapyrrole methylase family protein / MazG family protein
VVGLGPAGLELRDSGAIDILNRADRVFLRTSRHPAAADLGDLESFDLLYDAANSFEEVYAGIVAALVAAATALGPSGTVAYAVPGSPLIAEHTVELLREVASIELVIRPALSFLDLAWERLSVDPVAGAVRLVDATCWPEQAAGQRGPMLVAQCWSSGVLSAIKLSIETEEHEPPPVTVLHHLGLDDERVEQIAWH